MYPDRSLVVGCPHMRCMTRGLGNMAASTGLPPGKAVAISHSFRFGSRSEEALCVNVVLRDHIS